MKILIAVWLSVIATFTFTAVYMLPEGSSNAPGELNENLAAIGITLVTALTVMTAIALLVIFRNAKRRNMVRSNPAKT